MLATKEKRPAPRAFSLDHETIERLRDYSHYSRVPQTQLVKLALNEYFEKYPLNKSGGSH